MWRPTMLLLCLIAALAGTPLRQAEAAGDLARSLAELDGGDVVEETDGRVGDDPGETAPNPGSRSGSAWGWDTPATDDAARPMPDLPARSRGRAGPGHRPGPATSDPPRRHAWLQSSLF